MRLALSARRKHGARIKVASSKRQKWSNAVSKCWGITRQRPAITVLKEILKNMSRCVDSTSCYAHVVLRLRTDEPGEPLAFVQLPHTSAYSCTVERYPIDPNARTTSFAPRRHRIRRPSLLKSECSQISPPNSRESDFFSAEWLDKTSARKLLNNRQSFKLRDHIRFSGQVTNRLFIDSKELRITSISSDTLHR